MKTCIWPVKPEERLCRYCKLVHCADREKKGATKLGTVTPRMRAMDVGGVMEVETVDYNAARTAAFRLKREKGAQFSIFHKGNRLFVERIV